MITRLRMMLTCHWTGRHVHRYLDSDPAAPLTAAEISRLEGHLAVCARCAEATGDYRLIEAGLARLGALRTPDPAAVDRIRSVVHRLGSERGE